MTTNRRGRPSYLHDNAGFWRHGYPAEHVESHVFRPFGRILAHDFGITGLAGEKLLDYGCGAGASTAFFLGKGFDAYGVDISEASIAQCQSRLPECAQRFSVIEAIPTEDDLYFEGQFTVVTAIQCLYYLSPSDLEMRLRNLHRQMTPGGVLYATMIGTRHHYFSFAKPAANGMWLVQANAGRIQLDPHYVRFTESEAELVNIFSMFEACHTGYYAEKYRSDEGEDFHFTYVGRKA